MYQKLSIFPTVPISDDNCLTTADSPSDPGAECQFPFIFENVEYNSCPPDRFDTSKTWCSTRTNESGHHNMGQWGYCSTHCPVIEPCVNCNFRKVETSAQYYGETIPDYGICQKQGGESLCWIFQNNFGNSWCKYNGT